MTCGNGGAGLSGAPVAFLAVIALATTATAQAPCLGPTGPDIIVADLIGPTNWSVVGTHDAFSVGTNSCNLGTVGVQVIAQTNRHPVFGSSLHRLSVVDGAARFEQVGQSWLSHGFFALSQDLCCPGQCQPTDGTSIGVGCSDSNSSSRAGQPSVLGPRWQVNAFSGAFTQPPPHPSGGNSGRLEVAVADLAPTGGPGAPRYFAESHFVAPDDAEAGNRDNNASWREMIVSGAGTAWNLTWTGTTRREKPAIRAWREIDPTVRETDVRIPGEGLMVLASQVTALPAGGFRYEYALANINSDLCAGSFSVPVPATVVVVNAGFHDVDYRGGDGIGGVDQDGTDWPDLLAGGAISWATTPFAVDPNANALRWATTYNFRFDADAAPVPGLVTIGLFKTTGQVKVAAEVPGGPPPGGSLCAGDGIDPSVSIACPCGNTGAVGRGCENSHGTGGALLHSTGVTMPDSVALTASGMLPTALCIFLQGTGAVAGGSPFGDGIRCAGGTLKRLAVKSAAGGVATFPQAGDPSITAQSAALGDPIPPGGTRIYQTYYRDANPLFCPAPTGSTFNATNGQFIAW